jgi:hypothetical protein
MKTALLKSSSKSGRVIRLTPKPKPSQPKRAPMIETLEDRALCSVSPLHLTPSIPIPPPIQTPHIIAILIGL